MRDRVPEGEYFAARAGDSPFIPGELLPSGMTLPGAVPAWTFPHVDAETPVDLDYQVIFRDERIMVVDKPHFLPATPNGRLVANTVQTRLRAREGEDITVLHRLDVLTAGLLLCSRESQTRGDYQQLFANKRVHKTYYARVSGWPRLRAGWNEIRLPLLKHPGGRVEVNPTGRMTVTIARQVETDVVEFSPLTGFTHQLRVVAAWLGAPIVGDPVYGHAVSSATLPLHLVAAGLEFLDPFSGERRSFRSPRGLPARIYLLPAHASTERLE
ncbi:RluA family pseudouridine synthase [Corynebacterium tapiri]